MYNFSTGNEFTGKNLGILLESGKKLKGIKKAATLVRFVKQIDKVTGKEEKKPRYYSVFDIEEVLQRK